MAIANYSELQSAAANWLKRSDLATRIPEFITLGEARLNRMLKLRPKETDVALIGVVSSRFIALPSGFVEPMAFWIERDSGREFLTQVSPVMETSTAEGEPAYWSIDGTNIAFERPCDAAYDFTFRCLKTIGLSDADPTNSLLTSDPDAYLAATVMEGFVYGLEEERAMFWEQRLKTAVDEINQRESRSRKAPLRADPAVAQRASFNILTG